MHFLTLPQCGSCSRSASNSCIVCAWFVVLFTQHGAAAAAAACAPSPAPATTRIPLHPHKYYHATERGMQALHFYRHFTTFIKSCWKTGFLKLRMKYSAILNICMNITKNINLTTFCNIETAIVMILVYCYFSKRLGVLFITQKLKFKLVLF